MEAPPSYPVKPELRDSFLLIRDQIIMELDSLQYAMKLAAVTTDSLSRDHEVYTETL